MPDLSQFKIDFSERQGTAATAITPPAVSSSKLPPQYQDITSSATAIANQSLLFEQKGHNPLTLLTREYSELLANRIRASQSRVSFN